MVFRSLPQDGETGTVVSGNAVGLGGIPGAAQTARDRSRCARSHRMTSLTAGSRKCSARRERAASGPSFSSSYLYRRTFIARAATRRTVIAESVDSAAISALAGRVSGIASVGLNAIELVSDT